MSLLKQLQILYNEITLSARTRTVLRALGCRQQWSALSLSSSEATETCSPVPHTEGSLDLVLVLGGFVVSITKWPFKENKGFQWAVWGAGEREEEWHICQVAVGCNLKTVLLRFKEPKAQIIVENPRERSF